MLQEVYFPIGVLQLLGLVFCYYKDKTVKILETRVIEEGCSNTTGEITKITKEGIEVATEKNILLI